jgi:hypothetical protein
MTRLCRDSSHALIWGDLLKERFEGLRESDFGLVGNSEGATEP